MSHPPTPTSTQSQASTNGVHSVPSSIKSTAVAVILIVFVSIRIKDCGNTRKEEAQAAAAIAASQPMTPVVIGMQRTAYTFDSTGCVEIRLGRHWFDDPVGGKIKFIDVQNGQIVGTDVPGEKRKFSFGNGWFRICADDSKATGVDITQ